MEFISIVIGGILSAVILHRSSGGCLIGMLLGWLWARTFRQSQKLEQMEQRLREIETLLQEEPEPVKAEEPLTASPPVFRQAEIEPEQVPEPAPPPVQEAIAPAPAEPPPAAAEKTEVKLPPPVSPSFDERIAAKVKAFFTEGNVILRIGLLVLFFGVAFLLKYAADRNLISIELRLLGVALGGMALLGFGWRQRTAKPGFALLAQGGGIGIIYLTVFAAFKLYHLLPSPLAFILMLGLVAASTALALLQDSSPMALFGAAGGFLAPVLLSTDSGNHVALFSYYALLNSGILAVSWFRAWRSLNLLGFIFTLGIGAAWGLHSYQPQHFATAEPFLILFFLMFNAIGVLFAFRQPPNLRGYVDGTLIFGTPVICFSLQAGMVKDMPHGLAFSALAMSIFYIVLAKWLWNQGNERLRQGMRTLTEAFLALGVVFVTLAVPLALSGRWTAVAWAMEGAALTWVGIRQNRFLARSSGFLLQFGAGFYFLSDSNATVLLPLLNGTYLGAVIIALSAFFASWQLFKADNLRPCERWNHLPLFFWACLWWFCAGFNEIDRWMDYHFIRTASLAFAALSCAVLSRLAARLHWKSAAWPSLTLPVFMVFMALIMLFWRERLLTELGWLAWPLAFVLLHDCLRQGRGLLRESCLSVNHIISFLLLTFILTWESGWLMRQLAGQTGAWSLIVWGLIPAGMILLTHHRRLQAFWPLSEYPAAYQRHASAILFALLCWWLLAGSFGSAGNAAPLPYIPLLNPLELSQMTVVLLLGWWLLHHRDYAALLPEPLPIAAGISFIWLNTVLARTVHHWAGVSFRLEPMLSSRIYQTSLAIFWALLSLALMVTADRRQSRKVWFAGCALIGATVLKLFLIDLAKSGTVERIVSFISVGILVIVISWFSPLPPKKEEAE